MKRCDSQRKINMIKNLKVFKMRILKLIEVIIQSESSLFLSLITLSLS